MFGYLKPYKPELRLRELDDYKAVYCGLCKEQGKRFGLLSRLTLSYDFAFLALFLIALEEKPCASFKECSCLAHPFQKQRCCFESAAVSYSAMAATILTYYKLRDDLADRGLWHKVRAALFLPFAKSARKKALFDPDAVLLDEAAARMMEEQKTVEVKSGVLPDEAAEPTGNFLSFLLSLHAEGETEKRVLSRFGYLLGRYVYLCDALDDLSDDRKKGNFNPFLSFDDTAGEAKSALFLTTAELDSDLSLLTLYTYREIVENVVSLGLRAEVVRILKKEGGNVDGAESL